MSTNAPPRPESATPPSPTAPEASLSVGQVTALLIAAVTLSVAASLLAVGVVTDAGDPAASSVTNQQATAPAEAAPAGDAAVSTDGPALHLTEFAIDGVGELPAGETTITVVNDGLAPHEVTVGPVGSDDYLYRTRELAPGETQELTVELEPGSYELGCHLPGHYEAGMKAPLTVT